MSALLQQDDSSKHLSEGELVVSELLEMIMTDVYTQTYWDIAAKGRRLSERDCLTLEMITQPDESFYPDICSLVWVHAPSRSLVSYTLRDSHIELLQMRCIEQTASGYCGHYALHFALCLLEVCQSTNKEMALGLLGETASSGAYWRRYWFSVSQLLKKAQLEQWWPWTEEHVCTGDMERSFLRHLFHTDPHLSSLRGQDKVIILQYAYGSIQHTFEKVCKIQDKITSFVSSSGPTHLVFILGVTNHWVTLLAYKTKEACHCKEKNGQTCGCGRVGLVYMDSNNVPVMCYSDDDIIKHVDDQEKERMAIKGKGYDNWQRNVIKQAYIDQREIVFKLSKCLCGLNDLRQELAENYAEKVLTSFRTHVDETIQTKGEDLYIPLLLNWMETCYPPKILGDSLLPIVSHVDCLSMNCASLLGQWAQENASRLEDIPASGLSSVDSFLFILTIILNRLNF